MADADRCVMCGEIIPEGTQVCIKCSRGAKMENEKPTLDIDPEKLAQAVEITKRVGQALKETIEVIVAWWQAEIASHTSDYSSFAETLQKLSELVIDVNKYYRETPKRKHRTPYKRSCKTRLFDKRSRVHRCRNNC